MRKVISGRKQVRNTQNLEKSNLFVENFFFDIFDDFDRNFFEKISKKIFFEFFLELPETHLKLKKNFGVVKVPEIGTFFKYKADKKELKRPFCRHFFGCRCPHEITVSSNILPFFVKMFFRCCLR